MKKILFVLHGSNKDSGATKSLIDIIDKLNELKKYSIMVIVPNNKGNVESYLSKKNIKVYVYKYGNLFQDLNVPNIKKIFKFPIFCYRRLSIQKNVKKAAKFFKNMKVDLVYTNTSTILFGALLAKRISAKNIWHIREFGILDHSIEYFLGEKRMEKFIERNSNAVLCVSDAVKDYHSKFIDEKKMYVTYNSYSKDFIYERKKFNFDKKLEILLAGDIKPGKGQLIAAKAVKIFLDKYPDSATLHLAGSFTDKTYTKLIKKFIDENKLENEILLYGCVKEMYNLRKKMDIGIVSSECEAFGRTMIEGMLSSMCMIGRNSGGTIEQIKDNETGLLYDGTEYDLFKKIEKLYLDRNFMYNIARKGLEESIHKYTNGYSAKICEKTIDNVLKEEK